MEKEFTRIVYNEIDNEWIIMIAVAVAIAASAVAVDLVTHICCFQIKKYTHTQREIFVCMI